MPTYSRRVRIAFLLAYLAAANSLRADTFVIDPLRSVLTLSGTATSYGWSISSQTTTPNGLSTSFAGTIDATLGAGSITFNNSAAAANLSGTYQPAIGGGPGTAPANYGPYWGGGPWSGYSALREVIGSLSSGPITLSGGNFDASQLLFSFLSGRLDRYITIFPSGSMSGTQSLIGVSPMNGSGTGTLATSAGIETLTVPIDISFNVTMLDANDSTFRLRGNLVATSAVPEPSSYIFFGIGIAALAANTAVRKRV